MEIVVTIELDNARFTGGSVIYRGRLGDALLFEKSFVRANLKLVFEV